jgi:hypothetical protein
MKIYRRAATVMALLTLSLAMQGLSTAQSHQDSGDGLSQIDSEAPGVHDFDFLVGHWRVHHRKLKERLANNHEWVEFEGALNSQPLMGGYSNVDDLLLEVPGGAYRGVALRSFDSKTQQWSIWWLDSRTPLGPLDPPVQDHSDIVSLGAGILARRWQDVGDQLGAGHHTSTLIEEIDERDTEIMALCDTGLGFCVAASQHWTQGLSQIEPETSPAQESNPLWRCPKCGGPMAVIERVTAALENSARFPALWSGPPGS